MAVSNTKKLNITNESAFKIESSSPFQEVWYLKFNDNDGKRALWLRFTLLSGKEKKIAETWAIFFERSSEGKLKKTALKQTYGLEDFSNLPQRGEIRIGNSKLGSTSTRGAITSGKNQMSWDLQFEPIKNLSFDFVPSSLAKLNIVKNYAVTPFEHLRFSGEMTLDGKKIQWDDAKGMQGHLYGPKNGHSWAWGHCNTFVDKQGNPAPFVFDGLSAKARLTSKIASPSLSTCFFFYQEKTYCFNSFLQSICLQSKYNDTRWDIQAKHGDLSFHACLKANLEDFAGITYEDTDGSYLYCTNSKLSEMTVQIFQKKNLRESFFAKGTAAFEVVTRNRHPKVPLLI